MPSKSFRVAANGNTSLAFMAEEYSIVYDVVFIHSSVDGQLGCSCYLGSCK